VIAGETDSPDFPAPDGSQTAAGKDLWVGRLRFDPVEIPALRLFGGSGEERFGGLAAIPGQGLYLAGTTNSTDLPAASGSYQGGVSDGFISFLDPLSAIPRLTTYLGGSGRDEISAMETRDGDLFLGGTTDSSDLAIPGLLSGEGAVGGLDALFVLCDAFGAPTRGIRFGGTADDRIFGVEPGELGKVSLAGSSESREWLRQLDEFGAGLGGQDGFAVSVAFAALRIRDPSPYSPPVNTLYLGRDLQVMLPLQAVSEEGMDGVVLVRSTDPSKLLVSASSDLPGAEQILLRDVDQGPYSKYFVLQALADTGEVDVVIEGLSPASAKGIYPRQRLRVKLAPAALFFSTRSEVLAVVNNTVDVGFFQAAVLPDGSPGPVHELRFGVTSSVALITSDPDGLAVVRDSIAGSQGAFRAYARALREGSYTLTVASSRFPAGPGQSLTVRVGGSAPHIFSEGTFLLAKDHFTTVTLNASQGDTLRFTSDDPSRLLIGSDSAASSAAATLTFAAADTTRTLWIAAMSGEGTANVRVEGTYRGQPIAEAIRIRLAPYKVTVTGVPESAASGMSIFAQAQLVPQTPLNDPESPRLLSMSPRQGAFTNVRLRSSNTSVLESASQRTDPLISAFVAKQPGTAILDFGPGAPTEFAAVSVVVQVVAARLDFGASLIRIPAGTVLYMFPNYSNASSDALRAVRMRLSSGVPLTLESPTGRGTDLTVDFGSRYSVGLVAENAQAGQQGTLFFSAPGIAEQQIPIRVVEPVLAPTVEEIRVRPSGSQQPAGTLTYEMAAYDGGQTVRLPFRCEVRKTLKLRPTANPPGICEFPESMEILGTQGLSVPFRCASMGATVVALQPVTGVSSAQPQFTVRVISQSAPPAPLALSSRILTGNGLQSVFSLYTQSGLFSGTLTSSDPQRVRLSLDPKAPGAARITSSSNGTGGSVYVQGFASEGTATLTAESTDGRVGEITVHLFPSTMAVRPAASSAVFGDAGAILSMDQPLSSKDFTLEVRPSLVDAGSGKLIWASGLSIRGGTDPAFIRARSSDPAVIEAAPPDALVSDGDTIGKLKFHVNMTGDAVLSASQPEGFISVSDSSFRAHVFERELGFPFAPLLSADLQAEVSVAPLGGDSSSPPTTVTLTSLDPQKLVISSSAATAGQASMTALLGQPVYLQALSGVLPGEKVRVRLEGPGYAASEREVEFAAAELQNERPESTLSLRPLTANTLGLLYGPINDQGVVSNTYNGSLRPGVSLSLRISSSDDNIVSIPQPVAPLNRFVSIPLRALKPGRAQLRVEAPTQITNRTAAIDVVVSPFEFTGTSVEPSTRYLISRFTVVNPRAQPVTLTVNAIGAVPLRFGTASTAAGIPSSSSLTVTLAANETKALFLEPAGPGASANVRLNAPDFAQGDASLFVSEPQVKFAQGSLLNASLSNSTASVAIFLSDSAYGTRELPLGTAFGPLKIQLQSSNSQVVRAPAAPIEFGPGDSRKNAVLTLAGRGDAVVTLIVPAGFGGATAARQDLVVTVR
jgi:hypothetical protein